MGPVEKVVGIGPVSKLAFLLTALVQVFCNDADGDGTWSSAGGGAADGGGVSSGFSGKGDG